MLQVSLQNDGPIRLNAAFGCERGELLGLVGPSGSGKTSVLRAIAGLLKSPGLQGLVCVGDGPDDVWFDSARGIARAPQQRRVGMVFQHYALFPHLTAIENVAIAAKNTWTRGLVYHSDGPVASGLGWAARRLFAANSPAIGNKSNAADRPSPLDHRPQGVMQRVFEGQFDDLFERMGLDGLQNRKPATLSGGQQQRVALARALAREPQVLLLDEPFSAVDSPTRQALHRELAALRQRVAIPMVLVTHDLNEARRLADRVVILDAGESLQIGPPAKVFASPRNARVAELVGIQNHFQGQFWSATPTTRPDSPTLPQPHVSGALAAAGFGQLHWQSHACLAALEGLDKPTSVSLQVIDKGRLDDGARVSWVIAGELLELSSMPPTAAATNTVICTVLEVLPLGEISFVTLAPEALPLQRVSLNFSTAVLRQLGATPGATLYLHIPPAAVHIMPVRQG